MRPHPLHCANMQHSMATLRPPLLPDGARAQPAGAVAVNWTFPSSVTGVTASSGITYPFLNVVVREKPNTWFMGMLGVKSLPVGASCTCGLPPGTPSAPLVILNPTISSSLTLSGGAHIVIAGGPATSIQVNSSANGSPSSNASSNAVYCNGGNGYPIDTSTAGPFGNRGKCGHRRRPHQQPVMRRELHHEQHHACAVEESRRQSLPTPMPAFPLQPSRRARWRRPRLP